MAKSVVHWYLLLLQELFRRFRRKVGTFWSRLIRAGETLKTWQEINFPPSLIPLVLLLFYSLQISSFLLFPFKLTNTVCTYKCLVGYFSFTEIVFPLPSSPSSNYFFPFQKLLSLLFLVQNMNTCSVYLCKCLGYLRSTDTYSFPLPSRLTPLLQPSNIIISTFSQPIYSSVYIWMSSRLP